jgi:prepilin-type N-terminal cleavage/methylation domain-containing protein
MTAAPRCARGPVRPAGAGFTLLEVLIALAILGTAVVVSIQGVSQGLRLLRAAGDQQQAIIVADQKAREMLIPTEGTESGTDGRFTWQRTSRVLETPELTPVSGPPRWRVFEISVVVTWGEQRRLEVSTMRTLPATSDRARTGRALGAGPSAGAGQLPGGLMPGGRSPGSRPPGGGPGSQSPSYRPPPRPFSSGG